MGTGYVWPQPQSDFSWKDPVRQHTHQQCGDKVCYPLKIENLIDQNHLKPSSFILVGKLDTVTSVCIFQLQEDTHTFSSPKFPILQPHHMPVQVQILYRWPELKFLCFYFSFPMNHWKEIPKPFYFFLYSYLLFLIPPELCFIHVWKKVGVQVDYLQCNTKMYFMQVIAEDLFAPLINLGPCEVMSQAVFAYP